MKKEEFFNNLCQIAEMIALTFGPGCETVIHDCDDYDRFIAEIWNGHVSGRKKGDRIYIRAKLTLMIWEIIYVVCGLIPAVKAYLRWNAGGKEEKNG